ncbi:unnamed protein product [Gordionus sp. m RMFG-2023]
MGQHRIKYNDFVQFRANTIIFVRDITSPYNQDQTDLIISLSDIIAISCPSSFAQKILFGTKHSSQPN